MWSDKAEEVSIPGGKGEGARMRRAERREGGVRVRCGDKQRCGGEGKGGG